MIIVVILFVVFIQIFLVPAFRKFRMKDTIFTEKQVPIDFKNLPSVTIFPWKGTLFSGLKNGSLTSRDDFCDDFDSYKTFIKCIDENMFNKADAIKEVRDQDDKPVILDGSSWMEEVTIFPQGKSFTFKQYAVNEKMAVDLNPHLNYSIFIHDPDFYFPSINPEAFPSILFTIDDSLSQLIWMKVTYRALMDKDKQRCNSEPGYSFTKCIRESVSTPVGCKMPWDPWSQRKNCTSAQQLLKLNKLYAELELSSEFRTLADKTQCLTPCRFTQYEVSGQPVKYRMNYTRFTLKFSSFHANKKTEILLYPLESLFSELGGALGLLLGFSILMIWDTAESLWNCLHRIYQ